jgi:D-psicose/D-tagatose/L-ribulose 3-epimerase
MRLGVHALVWVGGWSPEDCRRAVSATAEAGYDLIEIPLLDPDRVDVADTRAVLDEYGISAACSLGLSPETDVSSDDATTVAAGRDLLGRALDVTKGIGADYLAGVLHGALAAYKSPPSAEGRANAAAAIRELCDGAAEAGITVGLEAVNRYENNMINTAEQAMSFIGDVGADNLVVHLDAYHMNIEERDFDDAFSLCGDRLGYVHVGESHRGALGTGMIDWPAFFAALDRTGYDGTITFESFSSAVVDPDLSSTLRIWRELWDDGMALATDARRFVEEHRAAAAA